MWQTFSWRVSVLLVCSLPVAAGAQDPKNDSSNPADEVEQWANETVADLQLSIGSQQRSLTMKEGSLLRWSNPIVGEIYGDSFLWTDQGQPAAFLSIYARYTGPKGNRRLTFQSLSEKPLTAKLDDKIVWSPKTSGIEYRNLKYDSPRPQKGMRRIQMRRIAKLFTGRISEDDEESRFRELRLLAAPLYTYQRDDTGIVDGSLFAFVDGTDPEILLLLEAVRTDNRLRWRYAPVRQNHRALQLILNRENVWEAPKLAPPFPNPNINDPAGIYFNQKWSRLQ